MLNISVCSAVARIVVFPAGEQLGDRVRT